MSKVLSVILPVYNVEPFLTDCLESCIFQDIEKEDYEIICVNDGSTDGSEKIVQQYSKKYYNIKLINQKNSGVSKARNIGFQEAKGEFVWFIDPDDFIEPNVFGYIVKKIVEFKADILKVARDSVTEEKHFDALSENEWKMGNDLSQTGAVWQYIVRRSKLLEKEVIFNEQLAYGEDYLWEYIVRKEIPNIIAMENVVYHYRIRHNSAMNSKSRESVDRHLEGMIKLAGEYKKIENRYNDGTVKNKEFLKNIDKRISLSVQAAILDLLRYDYTWKEIDWYIRVMKRQEIYPYAFQWENLKVTKSLKKVILGYITFLFPCKGYIRFWHCIKKKEMKKHPKYTCGRGITSVFSKVTSKQSMWVNQLRKVYNTWLKLKNKNHKFCIISSNCVGGCITHDLGEKFRSPTINLWFEPWDFIKFLNKMEFYLKQTLEQDNLESQKQGYPVGKLADIKIYFQHYTTYTEALEKWNQRKKRVDRNHIYVVMVNHSDERTDEEKLIEAFEKVPFEKKVFFTNHKEMVNGKSVFYIEGFEDSNTLGNLMYFQNKFGIKYYDQFDYIKWLNKKEVEDEINQHYCSGI